MRRREKEREDEGEGGGAEVGKKEGRKEGNRTSSNNELECVGVNSFMDSLANTRVVVGGVEGNPTQQQHGLRD